MGQGLRLVVELLARPVYGNENVFRHPLGVLFSTAFA